MVKMLVVLIIAALGFFLVITFEQIQKDVPECNDELGCIRIEENQPIELGVIQDLTSRASSFGTDQVRSYEIALAEINNELLGHKVELVIEDSKCLPEHGVLAARKLVSNPQIVAILGTTCSASAVKASQIISEAGFTMISGTNSASSLTSDLGKAGPDWYPGFFRTMFRTDKSGAVAAQFVFHHLKIRKAAIIHDGDTYTKGYASNFNHQFEKLGGKVVLHTGINKGDRNMIPVLTAVMNADAELLFTPIFNEEGIHIIKQKAKIPQLAKLKILGGNALINDYFLSNVGADAIGMYFLSIAPTKDSLELRELVEQFKTRYGEPPRSTLYDYGYDAAKILLLAIKSVAKEYGSGQLLISRKALRDFLYNLKDYKGITGNLSSDKFGDFGIARFNVVQLTNSETSIDQLKENIIYSSEDKNQLK